METVTLHAPNISCGHCIKAITQAVGGLAGVVSVNGNPESKDVTVAYQPDQVTLGAIEAAMAEEGYPVQK